MHSDEFLNIDTPENVIFGYEIVGIGSRFLAALIDTTIIVIVQGIVFFAIGLLTRGLDDQNASVLLAILGFVSFLLFWGYYIFYELTWNGRTPGKQVAGIRVIKSDGTPITLSEAIIRNLVRLVDFLPVGYGFGVVAMFIDGQSRRLGDMVAGTLVIRVQEDVTLDTLQKASAPPPMLRAPGAAESEAQSWPLHLLSDDDVRLAEEFLERRDTLSNSHELAYQITRRLMKKMALPSSQGVFMSDAVYLLTTIVRQYRKQTGNNDL